MKSVGFAPKAYISREGKTTVENGYDKKNFAEIQPNYLAKKELKSEVYKTYAVFGFTKNSQLFNREDVFRL